MAREKRLTEEERALLRAQTAAIPQQTAQAAADTEAKMRIAMQQLEAERAMATEKLGLGREEIGGRNQQAQLAAAIGLLDTGAKERIARGQASETVASDLAKRGDIDQKVLATALAESGQPGLYNALAQQDVAKREALISTTIPALVAAKSDEEREKNIKPALEAAFPGAYQTAVARAFPKPENEAIRAPATAARFQAPATTAGADLSGLVGTLLEKSGTVAPRGGVAAPTSPTGFPVLPNTPEERVMGRGALEGSQIVPGGIQTPSGGFIGGTLGADRLAKLISPGPASVATAPVESSGALNFPITTYTKPPVAPLVTQPLIPYDQLLATGPRPADIDVDKLLSGVVGQPTMEDLRKRQQFRY